MKVLVARTDQLGDLVVSLPVFSWLKSVRPDWEVHALVGPRYVSLVENHPCVDAVLTWSGAFWNRDSRRLIRKIRSERFDRVVLLQSNTKLAILVAMAGVPVRCGPYSHLVVRMLMNRGRRQNRSAGRKHERDYNLELAAILADANAPTEEWRPDPGPGAVGQRAGRAFRETEGIEHEKIAFIHPGSRGSSLDWEPGRFTEVANSLAARNGWRVFITGTRIDAPVIEEVKVGLSPDVTVLMDRIPVRNLGGVLATGDLMVGGSTGPVHLAAALGVPTVGLYPPAPTISPVRWRPIGTRVQVIEPAVACPATSRCLHDRCSLFNCMSQISSGSVVEAALNLVAQKKEGSGS